MLLKCNDLPTTPQRARGCGGGKKLKHHASRPIGSRSRAELSGAARSCSVPNEHVYAARWACLKTGLGSSCQKASTKLECTTLPKRLHAAGSDLQNVNAALQEASLSGFRGRRLENGKMGHTTARTVACDDYGACPRVRLRSKPALPKPRMPAALVPRLRSCMACALVGPNAQQMHCEWCACAHYCGRPRCRAENPPPSACNRGTTTSTPA